MTNLNQDLTPGGGRPEGGALIKPRILELTLTARGKGTAHAAPMCGFPHHQIEAYTAKLVRAGRRVAVCDQVEDPRKAKGLVRREVVRVVTPGTITDPEQLEAKEPNWIASIAAPGGRSGAAFLEVSTGAFVAWSAPDPGEGDAWPALLERLQTFAPREIVHPEDLALDDERRRELSARALLTPSDPFAFAPQATADRLARHFTQVMRQTDRLHEVLVAAERTCQGPADLGYLGCG